MRTLCQRVSQLEVAETSERLKYDSAVHSDIWLYDPGRFDLFANLFSSDGKWDDGDGDGPLSGREAIAEKLKTLSEVWSLRVGLHLHSNPRLKIESEKVDARWQTICAMQSSDSGKLRWAVGGYHETYLQENGALRISSTVVLPAFVSP